MYTHTPAMLQASQLASFEYYISYHCYLQLLHSTYDHPLFLPK